jgi:hypothetical protein
MNSPEKTRRGFLKEAGVTAAAIAAASLGDPTEALSETVTSEAWAWPWDHFTLTIELSGLFFLALVDSRLWAVINPTLGQGSPMRHFPRVFVHNENEPHGAKPDPKNKDYSYFDIDGCIEWPTSVPAATPAALPSQITRLTDAPHKCSLKMDAILSAHRIPLDLALVHQITVPHTTFQYKSELADCPAWGQGVQLAWKLIFSKKVKGKHLDIRFPGGPSKPLRSRENKLTLKIKNTIETYSYADDPVDDDDKYASHFRAHYYFLERCGGPECYPVREDQSFRVGGLYTCMPGGGG